MKPRIGATLRKWQRLLRLRDWTVVAEFDHPLNMNAAGKVNICPERKSAYIRIADPAVPPDPAHYLPEDWETALVHELLHIHLEPFFPDDGSLEYVMAEQAVDQLARVIVGLERANG